MPEVIPSACRARGPVQQLQPAAMGLPRRTLVGCNDDMGRAGVPDAEHGPVAWSAGDISDPAYVMCKAVEEAMQAFKKPAVRITILSGFYLENPAHVRERALTMSFGMFSHPSAGSDVLQRVAWVPVSHTIERARLATGIKAEAEHLSGRVFRDSVEVPGGGVDDAGDWLLYLWPVEQFGFTAQTGAEFLSEAAFGAAVTMPVPLSKGRPRRHV